MRNKAKWGHAITHSPKILMLEKGLQCISLFGLTKGLEGLTIGYAITDRIFTGRLKIARFGCATTAKFHGIPTTAFLSLIVKDITPTSPI